MVRAFAHQCRGWSDGKVGVNTWLDAFAISLVVGRKVGVNTWLECSLSVWWSDGR